MNQDEKRMADSYEIEFALMVNGKEIVFGTDEKTALRYMVGFCSLDPIFGIEHYHNCIATGSYAEALKEFGERVRTEAENHFPYNRNAAFLKHFHMMIVFPAANTNIMQASSLLFDLKFCKRTNRQRIISFAEQRAALGAADLHVAEPFM